MISAPGQGDGLHAFVRLDDGRYAGCGSVFGGATAMDFVVARFDSDGALDTTFNGSGYASASFLQSGAGGSLFDQCNAVAVQTDGMIVSAGVTYENGPASVALTRHTSAGVLDNMFGGDGKVDINASSATNGNSEAHALALQPDGKLLVAGFAYGNGHNLLLLMRLNTDGTPDQGFGTAGITRTPVGTSEDIANAIVRQPDGRIVIAGSAITTDGRRDFVLARYTENGVLDPSFGDGGVVTTQVGPGDDRAYALALMPWGRLVAAGSARISTSAAGTDLALVAYNADGTLDRYFGDAGMRMVDMSDFDDIAYGLAADIDGQHFWAVGTALAGHDARISSPSSSACRTRSFATDSTRNSALSEPPARRERMLQGPFSTQGRGPMHWLGFIAGIRSAGRRRRGRAGHAAAQPSSAAAKPVLAVLKFQDETGAMPFQGGIGRVVTNMLASEIAARDVFTVVERRKLYAIIEEQNLAESGLLKPGDGAKIGQLTGAQYLVMGTITAFEPDSETKVSGGLFRRTRIEQTNHGSYLAVDLRVVDTTTRRSQLCAHDRRPHHRQGDDDRSHAARRGHADARQRSRRHRPCAARCWRSSTISNA